MAPSPSACQPRPVRSGARQINRSGSRWRSAQEPRTGICLPGQSYPIRGQQAGAHGLRNERAHRFRGTSSGREEAAVAPRSSARAHASYARNSEGGARHANAPTPRWGGDRSDGIPAPAAGAARTQQQSRWWWPTRGPRVPRAPVVSSRGVPDPGRYVRDGRRVGMVCLIGGKHPAGE